MVSLELAVYEVPLPWIVGYQHPVRHGYGLILFAADEELTPESELYLPYIPGGNETGLTCYASHRPEPEYWTAPWLHRWFLAPFNSAFYGLDINIPPETPTKEEDYRNSLDWEALAELSVEDVMGWDWDWPPSMGQLKDIDHIIRTAYQYSGEYMEYEPEDLDDEEYDEE